MTSRFLTAILSALLLSSCATYETRHTCEKTNWYKYGESVAMSGQRLSGDAVIRRCNDVEAQIDAVALDRGFKAGMAHYCTGENLFQIGKRGQFFSTEMCDGEQPRFLARRHAEGVAIYCDKSNGFPIGATGAKYSGVCPKSLEPAFLVGFNRGRSTYLDIEIASNEDEIGQLEETIRHSEGKSLEAQRQAFELGDGKRNAYQSYVDQTTGEVKQGWIEVDDSYTLDQKRRLQGLAIDAQSEIHRSRLRQDSLRRENRNMRVEMTSLTGATAPARTTSRF